MSKALISGAGGFVGDYLINELKAHGREVVGLSNSRIPDCADIEWHVLDICDRVELQKCVNKVDPAEIYHLAAISNPVGFESHEYFTTNVLGTLNILECAKGLEADILVVGSAYAYGSYQEKISECALLQPVNAYGASKAAQDVLAGSFSYGNNKVIRVRPFNHTGPNQLADFLVPGIVSKIRALRPSANVCDSVVNMGNMGSVRDFLDVRDVVRAYRILMDETETSDCYNVCSGVGHSVAEVFQICREVMALDVSYLETNTLKRSDDIQSLVGNVGKLHEACSWRSQITLTQTIKGIVENIDMR